MIGFTDEEILASNLVNKIANITSAKKSRNRQRLS